MKISGSRFKARFKFQGEVKIQSKVKGKSNVNRNKLFSFDRTMSDKMDTNNKKLSIHTSVSTTKQSTLISQGIDDSSILSRNPKS